MASSRDENNDDFIQMETTNEGGNEAFAMLKKGLRWFQVYKEFIFQSAK